MSRSAPSYGRQGTRFPRVSGDEPWYRPGTGLGGQFSPRERG